MGVLLSTLILKLRNIFTLFLIIKTLSLKSNNGNSI